MKAGLLLGTWALALASPVFAEQALLPLDETAYPKLLAAHRGKILLVDFWATWCVPCRAEMPHLVKLEAQLRGKGFALLTVSADEPEREAAALKFLREAGAPAPWHIKKPKDDESFINSVDRKWSGALPALFLYDRQGRPAARFIGETEIKTIEAAIRRLL